MIIIASVICGIMIIVSMYFNFRPAFLENAVSFVVTPVQKAVTSVSSWFGDRFEFFTRLGMLDDENNRLKKEIDKLLVENSRLNSVEKENDNLAELLNIKRMFNQLPTIGANVIAKDPGIWYDTFIIDRGASDGLEKNMIVITGGGLVGMIMKTEINSATVTAIIDDTSSVSAKSSRTGDIGYVRGDLFLMAEGKCRMEFIDSASEIIVGDEIVTSNISAFYPPGILIGYVEEIYLNATGTKHAVIKVNVDFKHLDSVLVVTEMQNRQPSPAETPEN